MAVVPPSTTKDGAEDPEKTVTPGAGGQPPETPPKGSQTPPENQQAAFLEERRLRKEAEAEVDRLQSLQVTDNPPGPTDAPSDVHVLQTDDNTREIEKLKDENALNAVYAKYHQIRDAFVEFEQFRTSRPGVALMDLAVLFLNEKGMLHDKPEAIGLERPTGGEAESVTEDGLNADQLKDLRENHPQEYEKLIRGGKIQFQKPQ